MPGCVLRVSGEDFAVDEFLETSSLRPSLIWHKGDARTCRGVVYEQSGFNLDVSDVDGDLSRQSEDAMEFLRLHAAELRRLLNFRDPTDRRLDFGYTWRGEFVQCDYLPPDLLVLAGTLGIGIELSLYPPTRAEARSEE